VSNRGLKRFSSGAEAGGPSASRRALLGGGAASLGMLMASPLLGAKAEAATLPDSGAQAKLARAAGRRSGVRTRRRRSSGLGASGATGTLPYYVQASCELSQDFFSTDEVLVSPSDEVLAFTAPSGNVEAVVLVDQVPYHLRRDSSQTTGWSYSELGAVNDVDENLSTPVAQAATLSTSTNTAYLACIQGYLGGTANAIALYTLGANGTWSLVGVPFPFEEASLSFSADTPLRGGVASGNTPYFYRVDTSGVLQIWYVDPDGDFTNVSLDTQLGSSIADVRLLWNPTATGQAPWGFVVALDTNGLLTSQRQNGPQSLFPDDATELGSDVEDLVWAGPPLVSDAGEPSVVYQHSDGALYYTDVNNEPTPLVNDFGDTAGPGHAAVWTEDDLYTFAFLDTNGCVYVIKQFHDTPTSVQATAPIPLQGGMNRIYAQPTDAAQATIFAVDDTELLNVLSKDYTGMWSLVPVHRDVAPDPSAPLTEITAWRIQVRVLDARNSPVMSGKVRVSADRAVGFWQASGSTILDGDSADLALDGAGQVTLSVPATELDVALLTVQALDSSGDPTGSPFPVTPNTNVQGFMADSQPLLDIGTLTGAALLAATDRAASPTTTFPALQSASDPAAAAATMATGLAQLAMLGGGYQPPSGGGGTTSVSLDLTPYSPTTGVGAPGGGPAPVGSISSWFSTAEKDLESVFHGLRHGVTELKTLVANWDADAKQWVANLIVDIGDGLDTAMNFVISDVKTAIHAISAVFHALGADIVAGLNWLRHFVMGLLGDAGANAKVIETFFDNSISYLKAQITSAKKTGDGFFQSKKTELDGWLDTLIGDLTGQTFGTQATFPSPTSDTGSNTAAFAEKIYHDYTKAAYYVDGQWLWNKLESYLPGQDTGLSYNADIDRVVQDVFTAAEDAIDLVESFATLVHDTFDDLWASQNSLQSAEIATIFEDFKTFADDGLTLADALFDLVLDVLILAVDALQELFDHELEAPFISALLHMAGIDSTLTMKHVMGLIGAYPATLLKGVINGGSLFPGVGAAPSGAAQAASVDDPWACALAYVSCAIQFGWTNVDLYEDAKIGDDSQGTPSWTTWVDILSPIALMLFSWPNAKVNGLTVPFWESEIDFSAPGGGYIVALVLANMLPPVLGLASLKSNPDPNASPDYSDNGSLIITTLAGLAQIILGSLYNWASGADGKTKASTIIGGLSYIDSPLAMQSVVEETEGASPWVKVLVDGLSGCVVFTIYLVTGTDA